MFYSACQPLRALQRKWHAEVLYFKELKLSGEEQVQFIQSATGVVCSLGMFSETIEPPFHGLFQIEMVHRKTYNMLWDP